jgi:hypothetical protein
MSEHSCAFCDSDSEDLAVLEAIVREREASNAAESLLYCHEDLESEVLSEDLVSVVRSEVPVEEHESLVASEDVPHLEVNNPVDPSECSAASRSVAASSSSGNVVFVPPPPNVFRVSASDLFSSLLARLYRNHSSRNRRDFAVSLLSHNRVRRRDSRPVNRFGLFSVCCFCGRADAFTTLGSRTVCPLCMIEICMEIVHQTFESAE